MKIKLQKLLRSFEKLYVILVLFVLSRPLSLFLMTGREEFSGVIFGSLLLLYLIILPFVVVRLGRFLWVATRDKFLLLLVGLALLSVLWSGAKGVTLRRNLTLLGETFFGIYLAMRYSPRDQMRLLAWMFAVSIALSFVVSLAFPVVGIGHGRVAEAWTGVYENKNFLGRFMSISTILFWLLRKEYKRKWTTWIGFSLSLFLMLLARSATSLLVTLAVLVAIPLYRTWRWRDSRVIPVLISGFVLVVGLVLVFFMIRPDVFFEVLGRDPDNNTLFVRFELWDDLFRKVWQRPLLGYGFDAFWVEDGPAVDIWTEHRWHPTQAHNGYLEIWLQLGLIGLMAVVGHLLLNFRRAIILMRSKGTVEQLWTLALLTFLSLTSLTYVTLLIRATIFWSLYVSATIYMCTEMNCKKKPVTGKMVCLEK